MYVSELSDRSRDSAEDSHIYIYVSELSDRSRVSAEIHTFMYVSELSDRSRDSAEIFTYILYVVRARWTAPSGLTAQSGFGK